MICLVLAIVSLWKYSLSIKSSSRLGYLKLFICYCNSNCRNWLVEWRQRKKFRNFSESNSKRNHAPTRNFYLKFMIAIFSVKISDLSYLKMSYSRDLWNRAQKDNNILVKTFEYREVKKNVEICQSRADPDLEWRGK